jgi:Tol biopolymer transport system component
MSLWLFDFSRHTLTPFATTGGSSQGPIWTPDGKRIVYRGTRNGTRNLYWKLADGSGEEERLTTKADVSQTPTSFSPDGQRLVFNELGVGAVSMWTMSLQGDRTPHLLIKAGSNGHISADGRWLAYQSDVSGRSELYAQPFPGPGPRIQISTAGGVDPAWSKDGRELFYSNGDEMLAVAVPPGGTLSVGAPRVLYKGRYHPNPNGVTAFGVSADSRRFLRIQQVQPDRPVTRIDIVLNWMTELTQRAAR